MQQIQNCNHYKLTMREAARKLTEFGIRPSLQRVQIYHYLLTHRTHPTVDEIHTALSSSIPTLSKTTVYNTLTLFVEKGATLELNIDEKNQRYDAYTEEHAHFQCRCCGKVYDIALRPVHFAELSEGFIVTKSEISFKGICKNCSSNN